MPRVKYLFHLLPIVLALPACGGHEQRTANWPGSGPSAAGPVESDDTAGVPGESHSSQSVAENPCRSKLRGLSAQLMSLATSTEQWNSVVLSRASELDSAAVSQCNVPLKDVASVLRKAETKSRALPGSFRETARMLDEIAAQHSDDQKVCALTEDLSGKVASLVNTQASQEQNLARLVPPETRCMRLPLPIYAATDFGSYHMITSGQLQENGRLVLKTEVNEHRALAGDCGRPYGFLYDKDGNELLRISGERTCVDGKHVPFAGPSVRFIFWDQTIPSDVIKRVRAIVFYHVNDAPPPIEKLNETIRKVKEFAKDHEQEIQVIAAAAG